jgi:hypothetical protein
MKSSAPYTVKTVPMTLFIDIGIAKLSNYVGGAWLKWLAA